MYPSDPRQLSISDFDYELPASQIAHHPLENRDASRLLIYQAGQITDEHFVHIDQYLPKNGLMIFNESKVIPARIFFTKENGTRIEIFCLEPLHTSGDYGLVMNQTRQARWKCMIGGASKWKNEVLAKEIIINGEKLMLKASLQHKEPDYFVVEFHWESASVSFAEILSGAGDIPLPPYIKRNSTPEDATRYQTIYAKQEGSVAAPTAGLHFTEEVLQRCKLKGIARQFVTLHVGAGTFKPVKASQMDAHDMHAEWIDVSTDTIQAMLGHEGPIIAVGTTSLRTIESLYWMGVKAILNPALNHLNLLQWEVYSTEITSPAFSKNEALKGLLKWLQKNNQDRLYTQTQIIIAPGYNFKIASALVTNFHQPKSTLLLLVAAAIGQDWKLCYDFAVKNQYRFLSYGDSSLLYMNP